MWAGTQDAREHWPDASTVPDAVLNDLLAAAQEECAAYAPALARTVTATTTNGSAVLVATGDTVFALADVGATVVGADIPGGATVQVFTDTTHVTLTGNATADGTGVALTVTRPTPTRYKLAVVYQAREVFTASQRGESDVIGVGDFAIRARPLTGPVKQLLRPQTPSFTVG
jgi:hypothetical protein